MKNALLGAAAVLVLVGAFVAGRFTVGEPKPVTVTVASPSPTPSPSPVIEERTPQACSQFIRAAEDLVDARVEVGRILFEVLSVTAQGGTIEQDLYSDRLRSAIAEIEDAERPYRRLSEACRRAA
jgi:hypothetical protein